MASMVVLNYHGIESREGEYAWTPEENVYVLKTVDLETQLDLARTAGFKALSETEVLSWLAGKDLKSKLFCLTFDDGHISHFQHAAPRLKDRGMTGIFFVSAGLVGQEGYMTWEHLKELAAEGFEIGSHGYHHLPLPPLKSDGLKKEIEDSKKELEQRLGIEVRSFSVPRGFYQPRIRETARKAGYKLLFTSHYGVNSQRQDPMYLKRIALKKNTTLESFAQTISGNLGSRVYIEEVKERARQLLGPRVYGAAAAFKARAQE